MKIGELLRKIDPFRSKRVKTSFINLLKKILKTDLIAIVDKSDKLNIDLGDVKKILVVRQHNQLGDMLCAVPLLRALRQKFPSAEITLITSPVNYEVMKDNPYIDEILNFNKVEFLKSPKKFFDFIKKIKSGFDIAIVPSTVSISTTSNLIAYISKARIRIGPKSIDDRENPTSFLFNYQVILDWRNEHMKHQTERNLDIVRPFGIETEDLSYVIPSFDEDKEFARKFLKEREKFNFVIGYHPGAGKPPNRWDALKFAELAIKLAEKFNALTLITAGPMDDEPVKKMIDKIEGKLKYLVLKNEKISRIVAVIESIDLFITNDTGIMHVAGATQTPVISLFGPTNPYQWSPLNKDKFFIWSKTGNINDITVEQVYNLAKEILLKKISTPKKFW
jgi:heptosyltransferase-2